MSNYPNMSYCMNENTVNSMDQVLAAMQDEGPMFLLEMSASELHAFKRLFNQCEAFLTLAEELESRYEEFLDDPYKEEEDLM